MNSTTLMITIGVAIISIGFYMLCKCNGGKSEFFVGKNSPCPSGQKRCCDTCGCVLASKSCWVNPGGWFGCQGCCLGQQICQQNCNKNDATCLANCDNSAGQCFSNNNCQPIHGNNGWTYCS